MYHYDGDAWFEFNEEIIIEEDIVVETCAYDLLTAVSNIEVSWGCGSEVCAIAKQNAVVDINVDYDYGEILNGRHTLGWSADLQKLKDVHDHLYSKYERDMLWTQGVESNRDDFNNLEVRSAAYVMAEINIGEKLMILPGL